MTKEVNNETRSGCVCVLSCVRLFAAPWTVVHQAPLSTEFFRREYWSRLPFPTPGDLPNPGTESMSLMSPALAGRFFTTRSVMPKSQNLPVTTRELISAAEAREFLLPSSSWGSHRYQRSGYREEPRVWGYTAFIGNIQVKGDVQAERQLIGHLLL